MRHSPPAGQAAAHSLLTTILSLVLLQCADGTSLAANEKLEAKPPASSAETSTLPNYPRVNLASAYQVVPNWAQIPPSAKRASVPSIVLDKTGNVWAYTRTNPVVQIYTPDGRFLKGWREENPKTVPHGIDFDSEGNVWLVDAGLHTVSKFSPEGKLLQTLGVQGEAGVDDTHFNSPTGIAFTPDGSIFISDGYGNSRVVRYDKNGRYVKAWGELGVEPGKFTSRTPLPQIQGAASMWPTGTTFEFKCMTWTGNCSTLGKTS